MTNQLTDADVQRTRERLDRFLSTRTDLGAPDIAAHTTLCDATVKAFRNANCRGGRDVVGQINRVLDMAEAGEILQPGGGKSVLVLPEQERQVRRVAKHQNFYETQTVRKIGEVLDYCAEHAAIGVVTADFGVGKTEAVKAWRQGRGRKLESIVFEFDEFSSSNKVDFIGQVAKMLGLEFPTGSQNAGRVFRAVCERLQEAPALLIFDQCETVRARVFQIIRQIWDRTQESGVGVVILAAPVLMARMVGSRMADLGALTSRVGIWAPLGGITKAEMAAIVKQEGIADIDEEAFDAWYKATGGSMRRLMRSLDLMLAKHCGKPINQRTVAGVAGHLWGMQTREAA